MAARSIASLSLSFGLVSIPVKLYSATDSSEGVGFNLMTKDGSRVKQQYISEKTKEVVPRAEMIRGYEFDKDQFVLFTPDELKALQEGSSHIIDIVAFVPEKAIDPLFYDKAYFLAPDKRGGKPYSLLMEAMRTSGRCALAKWAWKGKQYMVQVRPAEDGLVLQQLLYADEVRSMKDLEIELVDVAPGELKLALQLIEQISTDNYDPTEYKDEEKERILAAIDEKIQGKEIVAAQHTEDGTAGNVIDLMQALQASLAKKDAKPQKAPAAKASGKVTSIAPPTKERKGPVRAKAEEAAVAAAPVRARAKK
jgi:DNA end-binding protein Ku